MKTVIRQQAFETNSSSEHALVFSKDYDMSLASTIAEVKLGEYGWEFEKYTLPSDRLSYLWTGIMYSSYKDPATPIIWETYIRQELELPDSVTFQYESNSDSWANDGYIDHSSELRPFFDALLDDAELLRAFVYGQGYIETGNDNEEWPEGHPMENEWDNFKGHWDDATEQWVYDDSDVVPWETLTEWNGGWLYLKGN